MQKQCNQNGKIEGRFDDTKKSCTIICRGLELHDAVGVHDHVHDGVKEHVLRGKELIMFPLFLERHSEDDVRGEVILAAGPWALSARPMQSQARVKCQPWQQALGTCRPKLFEPAGASRLGIIEEGCLLVIKEDELVAVACAPPTAACRFFAPGLALGRQS